ncbi:hypothetical protein LMG26857_01778 [Achromobacter anxifer]|uniref:hypothetical protein n=1 Tax=Achromobacter anxifer TaxID=1287737 RepID=UPI00155BD5EA|nr:hypothetical protein [Achromobacter anxifer]CAB5512488.1 hypothetical protein LMG26857_01778 [Achromobacter anxifer]
MRKIIAAVVVLSCFSGPVLARDLNAGAVARLCLHEAAREAAGSAQAQGLCTTLFEGYLAGLNEGASRGVSAAYMDDAEVFKITGADGANALAERAARAVARARCNAPPNSDMLINRFVDKVVHVKDGKLTNTPLADRTFKLVMRLVLDEGDCKG